MDGANGVVIGCRIDDNYIGISISQPGCVVGGSTPAEQNVIVNNGNYAITISNSNIRIAGNLIGADGTGNLPARNTDAVDVTAGSNIIIGGAATADRNIIAGGRISVRNSANQILIQNNYMGIGADGNTVMAGTSTSAASTCSGLQFLDNLLAGVSYLDTDASNSIIKGNIFGMNASTTTPTSHMQRSLAVGGSNVHIGGPGVGEGNLIVATIRSLSNGSCCEAAVSLGGLTDSFFEGNIIGLSLDGHTLFPNTITGLLLYNSDRNHIGGPDPGQANVIAGSGTEASDGLSFPEGIRLMAGSDDNIIRGNAIGTDATGTLARANRGCGIVLDNSSRNLIGGSGPNEGNIIAGNKDRGIALRAYSNDNIIQGNLIGAGAGTTLNPIPNLTGGISIDASFGNLVGGLVPGAANYIRNNGGPGVELLFGAAQNQILGNSINANVGPGIRVDIGANGDVTAPAITDNAPLAGTANADGTIELFVDDDGEGKTLVATAAVSGGHWSATADLAAFTTEHLTATFTDNNGNTSEFSDPFPLPFILDGPGGDVAVDIRDNHRFAVSVTRATGTVHYQWYFRNAQTNLVPIGGDHPYLDIVNAADADEGHYYVVVSDDVSSQVSFEAALDVVGTLPLGLPSMALIGFLLLYAGLRTLTKRGSV